MPKNQDQEFVYDAFISHASEDFEWCRELVAELKKAKLKVWFDERHVDYGGGIPIAINNGLQKSRRVVIVMTPEYFDSEKDWTLAEASYALSVDPAGKRQFVIPILLRECNIPPLLQPIKHIDFRRNRNFKQSFGQLKSILKNTSSEIAPAALHQVKDPLAHVEELRQDPVKKKNRLAALGDFVAAFILRPLRVPALIASAVVLVMMAFSRFGTKPLQKPASFVPSDPVSTTDTSASGIKHEISTVNPGTPNVPDPDHQTHGRKERAPKNQPQRPAEDEPARPLETKKDNPEIKDSSARNGHNPRLETPSVLSPQPLITSFRVLSGGAFEMGDQYKDGDPDEMRLHPVRVDRFQISAMEITNAQFCVFLNERSNQIENGGPWLNETSPYCLIEKSGAVYQPRAGFEDHPVVEVSWYGAKAFCQWLGEREGKNYRLPTEAEWEYAARQAGTAIMKYPNGKDNISPEEGNFYGANSRDLWDKTAPVASFSANILGLYDLDGNVAEWCEDWYHPNFYEVSTEHNPAGPGYSTLYGRVVRGASWEFSAEEARVSRRGYLEPHRTTRDIGFRIVLSEH